MDISFSVRLPVDSSSVPFVRGLCRQALEHLAVEQAVIDEITVALTEACANAVQHAGAHEDFEVQVALDDGMCRISVLDDGRGFGTAGDGGGGAAEGGGMLLMRALVDRLHFQHEPGGRHRVTLEKRLSTRPPLRLLEG